MTQSHLEINGFLANLERYEGRQRAAIKRGIYAFAWDTLEKASLLCPASPTIEFIPGVSGRMIKNPGFTGHSGRLRDSYDVGELVDTGGTMSLTIGFNTEYAVFVHEILDAYHPTGRSKFLETAMRNNAPRLMEFIEAALQEEFGN